MRQSATTSTCPPTRSPNAGLIVAITCKKSSRPTRPKALLTFPNNAPTLLNAS